MLIPLYSYNKKKMVLYIFKHKIIVMRRKEKEN